jgi:hypothetical protein
MDHEARWAVVAALVGLAGSPDYRDRADAGRSLAGFAAAEEAREPLLELLLDAADTFVTRVTAEALLRRQDEAGLALVASAMAEADFNHVEWMRTAVMDVFAIFARDRDAALRVCQTLTRDRDERVRRGAAQLGALLAGIDPVFFSPEDGS